MCKNHELSTYTYSTIIHHHSNPGSFTSKLVMNVDRQTICLPSTSFSLPSTEEHCPSEADFGAMRNHTYFLPSFWSTGSCRTALWCCSQRLLDRVGICTFPRWKERATPFTPLSWKPRKLLITCTKKLWTRAEVSLEQFRESALLCRHTVWHYSIYWVRFHFNSNSHNRGKCALVEKDQLREST